MGISPNGKLVAALVRGGGSEEPADHVRIWDLRTKKDLMRLRPGWSGSSRGRLFAFTPDGTRLVCSSQERIYVFDLARQRLSHSFKPKSVDPNYAALTPNGKTVACAAGGKVGLYDLASGKELAVIPSPPLARQVVISADGAVLAVSHLNGRVSLYDLKKNKPLPELQRTDKRGYWKVALSQDGKQLVATYGSEDNKLIDLGTREVLHRVNYLGHEVALRAEGVAFASNGKRIVSAGHGTGQGIFVWEPATGKVSGDKSGDGSQWTCMALSKDGRTVVVGHKVVKVYALRDKDGPEP